jgi:lipopolysaccharide biosynthesis regulator YciM
MLSLPGIPRVDLLDTPTHSEASRQSFLRDTQELCDRLAARVQKNRDSLDDYILLGRLYRLRADPKRALRLHRNLLTRPFLDRATKVLLLTEIGFDLQDLRAQDFGESNFLEALGLTRQHVPALQGLARAYEFQKKYEAAADILNRLIRIGRAEGSHLAFVQTALALELLGKKRNAGARRAVQKALRADPDCLFAHLTLADVYLESGRPARAIETLKEILLKWPSHSFQALRRLEDAHYRMNAYPKLEETLKECIRADRDNFYLHHSLARHLRKKKRSADALTALSRALELNPSHASSLHERFEMAEGDGDAGRLRRLALDFLASLKRSRRFICPNCRQRYNDLRWQCDVCGVWSTFEIRYEFPAP